MTDYNAVENHPAFLARNEEALEAALANLPPIRCDPACRKPSDSIPYSFNIRPRTFSRVSSYAIRVSLGPMNHC